MLTMLTVSFLLKVSKGFARIDPRGRRHDGDRNAL